MGKHHRCLERFRKCSPHRWQCKGGGGERGGKGRVELKRSVVFRVVDYFEELTAWKSETLKQFYVIHIQWIRPIAETHGLFELDGAGYELNVVRQQSVSATANASAEQVTLRRGVGMGVGYKV